MWVPLFQLDKKLPEFGKKPCFSPAPMVLASTTSAALLATFC